MGLQYKDFNYGHNKYFNELCLLLVETARHKILRKKKLLHYFVELVPIECLHLTALTIFIQKLVEKTKKNLQFYRYVQSYNKL